MHHHHAHHLLDECCTIVLKGIVGIGAPVLAVLTSFQEQLEHWMRVATLGAGFLVSVMTLVSLIRNWNKPND